MVVVPPGSFIMGATPEEIADVLQIGYMSAGQLAREGPQHKVTIARAFALGKYDVTFAEWDACVADGGCGGYHPDDQGWGRGNRPVTNVSWNDAQTYIAWLNSKLNASKRGQGSYRLPSEAGMGICGTRWRDGAAMVGCQFGGSAEGVPRYRPCQLQRLLWVNGSRPGPTPVGSFPPNPFGLYDMLGNVFQMTADCWNETYSGAPSDGSLWMTGDCTRYADRGGNFWADASGLRTAYRILDRKGNRSYGGGFRVAKTGPQ